MPQQTWGLPGHIPGERGSAACHGSTETSPGLSLVSISQPKEPRAACWKLGSCSRSGRSAPEAPSRPRVLLPHGFGPETGCTSATQTVISLLGVTHARRCQRLRCCSTKHNKSGIPHALIWGWNQTGVESGLPSWKGLQSTSYAFESCCRSFSQRLV